jgi:hypothetical protein
VAPFYRKIIKWSWTQTDNKIWRNWEITRSLVQAGTRHTVKTWTCGWECTGFSPFWMSTSCYPSTGDDDDPPSFSRVANLTGSSSCDMHVVLQGARGKTKCGKPMRVWEFIVICAIKKATFCFLVIHIISWCSGQHNNCVQTKSMELSPSRRYPWNFQHFIQSEGSLPCSQQSLASPHPEPE